MNTSVTSGRRLIALSIAASLALVACGSDDSSESSSTESSSTEASVTTEAPMASDVEISGAWARTSPMMASMGAAYMSIVSMDGDRLLAAAVDSSIAASAEVHEVVPAEGSDTSMPMGTGEMVMREVEAIEIPAGEMVMLMPGGYHVMLIDLVAPLEIGQTFDVVLAFENAGDVVVRVEVRDDAP